MTTMTATPAPATVETGSPCGCGGCDKLADCAYCETCIEQFPWVAVEALGYERWEREHTGSFGDWLAAR